MATLPQNPSGAQKDTSVSGASLANQQLDIDPVGRFQELVPQLQEALSNLMQTAAAVFHQNSQADTCSQKSSEMTVQRVEKCLEDFYSICDQIELQLRLAIECSAQNADSNKNTPVPIVGRLGKTDAQTGQPEPTQSYAHYLGTVRTQISCAREIHDSLVDCAARIVGSGPVPHPTSVSQAGMPTSMPQQSMTGMAGQMTGQPNMSTMVNMSQAGMMPGQGIQGGMQGGIQGVIQSGIQGGMQGGIQGGMQGGIQSGMQGGMQGGIQGGMQGGMGPGGMQGGMGPGGMQGGMGGGGMSSQTHMSGGMAGMHPMQAQMNQMQQMQMSQP